MPAIPAVLAAAALMSGCVVESVNPWLSEATRAKTFSLEGTWTDTEKEVTLTMAAPDKDGEFSIRTQGIPDKKTTDAYVGTLHLVQSNLFLMVGPVETQTSRVAVLPMYLLYRVQVDGNKMKMYEIDRKALLKRMESLPLSQVAREHAKDDDPITLTATTGDMEKFIRKCASEPDFFVPKPIFQFEKGVVPKK